MSICVLAHGSARASRTPAPPSTPPRPGLLCSLIKDFEREARADGMPARELADRKKTLAAELNGYIQMKKDFSQGEGNKDDLMNGAQGEIELGVEGGGMVPVWAGGRAGGWADGPAGGWNRHTLQVASCCKFAAQACMHV